MIALWNRREVYVGFSIEERNEVVDAFVAEDISYASKCGAGTGLIAPIHGGGSCNSTMNYIYVHKKDADRAKRIVEKVRINRK